VAKNEQSREANQPIWFDGKSINEALFCDDFLGRHKIIYTNGAFFTPDGRVTDELPLRGEIFEELKCCAVSNIPRKISNIVELMKLAAAGYRPYYIINRKRITSLFKRRKYAKHTQSVHPGK
jgi:putative DNA primase/helicase